MAMGMCVSSKSFLSAFYNMRGRAVHSRWSTARETEEGAMDEIERSVYCHAPGVWRRTVVAYQANAPASKVEPPGPTPPDGVPPSNRCLRPGTPQRALRGLSQDAQV